MTDKNNTAPPPAATIGRRQLLAGGVAAAGALVSADLAQAATTKAAPGWDMEADLVCVGSGAAACSAAVTGAAAGAQVIMVEKLSITGGTTGKSGGVAWIPNNRFLREKGIVDAKADAMRYMVRYSYPRRYTPNSPTLGVSEQEYRLIEAFYDNGSLAVENLEKLGAVRFQQFKLFFVNRDAPDYADHVPENKVPTGRSIEPAVGSGGAEGGNSLASQMAEWLEKKGQKILTDHRVTKLVRDGAGRVAGVEAVTADGKTVRIGARRAVVFGTGGYVHNTDLIDRYQTAVYGSCATPGATGDFIPLATEVGAMMGNLSTAWRSQVLVEDALENRMLARCADYLPGDSMIVVNKFGKRAMNEKRDYNDRGKVHFTYDPTREEYPNQLLFMIFDERSIDAFAGSYPFPTTRGDEPGIIEAPTLDALADVLAKRLAAIADKTGGVALEPEFKANMLAEIGKFNGYAKAGRDPDFDRGLHLYDREWQLLFSARRADTKYPANPFPNVTMHPIADKGPFYAVILGAGALDTNAGPMINEHGQVLDHALNPIPGLYGAGNCIASPSREAYYGAGCTIGLGLTYGYIAANHALRGKA